MHILLTDIATCPRCGPDCGLILLVEQAQERQVESGWLACPNCRTRYPIRSGVADLRLEPEQAGRSGEVGEGREEPLAREVAERLVALAGVVTGPARLLVAGPLAETIGVIGELIPEMALIAVTSHAEPGEPGVDRIASEGVLPLRSGSVAGAVLTGTAADELLEEGARVLSAGGRLVLQPVPAEAPARLVQAGLNVLAADGATLVAMRR